MRRDGHVSAAGWLLIGAVMRRMHVRPRPPIRVLILLLVSSYYYICPQYCYNRWLLLIGAAMRRMNVCR